MSKVNLIICASLTKRFYAKFNTAGDDECWEWLGSKDGKGYGTLSNKKGSSPFKAHRVSWAIKNNRDPKGFVICHKCDNPSCVNPNHLFSGTQKDNMIDCSKKGRLNSNSLENLRKSQIKKLSEHQVSEIKNIKFAAKNGRGGATKKSVAKKYGVCVDLIIDIAKGRY